MVGVMRPRNMLTYVFLFCNIMYLCAFVPFPSTLSRTFASVKHVVYRHSDLCISAAVNQEIEAKISVLDREINAIKFVLTEGTVGDPENPYIKLYKLYTIKELKLKEKDLQTEKNILLQQQLAAVQTSQGKIVRFSIYIFLY